MDDELLLVSRIDHYRSICVSSLATETILASDAAHLGDTGYFVYEIDDTPAVGGIHVLAKVASLEAAFRLGEIWRSRAAA